MKLLALKDYTPVMQLRLKADGYQWNRTRKGWFQQNDTTHDIIGIWKNPHDTSRWTLYTDKGNGDETWNDFRSLSNALNALCC